MPESPAGEMVELNFDDETRIERLPFERMFRAPAAKSSGSLTCKSWRLDHSFQLFCEPGSIFVCDRRRKTDVIQLSGLVVESQE
jgi:hypothetical protein